MHTSWITDQDDIVANSARLDDAHQFAARLSSIYVQHQLGDFAMNTPAGVFNELSFEDYLAIPDLAAGMIGEVLATSRPRQLNSPPPLDGTNLLSQKADIIADWFWHNDGTLKKSCILIQRAENGKFGIGTLGMQPAEG